MVINENSKLNTIKYKNVVRSRNARSYNFICLLLIAVSIIVCVVTMWDFKRPHYYDALCLLPLSFIVLLIININKFNDMFSNFGVMLIVVLEFVRLVITPLFLVWSGYFEMVKLNVETNTPKAIGLLVYEVIVISLAIRWPTVCKKTRALSKNEYKNGLSKLHILMALYTVVLITVCVIAPEILLAHRTIWGVFTDKAYTSMTLDMIISLTPSAIKRGFLIVSRFLLVPYRLLLPAYLIIVVRQYFHKCYRWLCWLLSFFPLLMVNDVIAQSLYFTMFLLLLNCFMSKVSYKTIAGIIIASAMTVVIYFCARYLLWKTDGSNIVDDFAKKLVTYFSGLNIVSGTYNQPDTVDKIQYMFYDFLKAIPFNKTLLGLDQSVSSAALFNNSNLCEFQIPSTIGMCCFYFGPIFAPLYSFFLTRFAKWNGQKLNNCEVPLLKLVYMFTAFILALGIVMYNIEIACTTLVQVVLPIYIIAKLAFGRNQIDT